MAWTIRSDQEQLALIIRLGEDGTELTLLSGRRLLLYRAVEVGMEAILEEAAKGTFASPVQTLDAGKLTVLGRDTVVVSPEEDLTLVVRYRLYANDTTGTLTIALYEQPAPPEGQSLGPGAATIDMAIIDDDD